MNKEELEKVLGEKRVDTIYYDLGGKKNSQEGAFKLEFADNEWCVYTEERGRKFIDGKFATEDEACQYIYSQLEQYFKEPSLPKIFIMNFIKKISNRSK